MDIYLITNLVNGKYYVGQAKWGMLYRWQGHKIDLKNGEPYPIYRAMRKYGLQNFKLERLCVCITQEELNIAEKFLISIMGATLLQLGYNVSAGGQDGNYNEASKKRMSRKKFEYWGNKTGEERRVAMAPANQTPWTDERRQNMSNFQKVAQAGSGNSMYGVVRVSPFKGKSFPESAKKILSEKALARAARKREQKEILQTAISEMHRWHQSLLSSQV